MVLREGRYGPYVTDGETNASLRRGDDVDTLTAERAAELLADRRLAAPAKKAAKARKAAKKTTRTTKATKAAKKAGKATKKPPAPQE